MPRVFYDMIRFFLAIGFFVYGIQKVFDLQFSNVARWPKDTMVGDIDGYQLAWRFFAYSRGYQFFIGAAEVAAAGLLLFRPTAVLGAVLFFPIVLNVVLIDVCYGVDTAATVVALALLCGDVVLLARDWRRLGQAFTLLIVAAPIQAEGKALWWRVLSFVLAIVLAGIVVLLAFAIHNLVNA